MRRTGIVVILFAAGLATFVAADKPQPKERADVRKTAFIEAPTKELVKNTADLDQALKALELDFTKGKRIEAPTKRLVNGSNPVAQPITLEVRKLNKAKLDRTKVDVVELPTKNLVRKTEQPPIVSASRERNPKVAPGTVRWHATFEKARAASRESGKPVMLFQMMGNLDDQFC